MLRAAIVCQPHLLQLLLQLGLSWTATAATYALRSTMRWCIEVFWAHYNESGLLTVAHILLHDLKWNVLALQMLYVSWAED